MRKAVINNIAPTGLSCGVYAFSVSCASLAYGYVSTVPAGHRFMWPADAAIEHLTAKSRRDDKCITVCKRSVAYGDEESLLHLTAKSHRDDKCVTVCKRSAAYGYEERLHHTTESRRDEITYNNRIL
jgi:NAD-dependent dihydropyrimidine dehydrogenase PreA subunit